MTALAHRTLANPPYKHTRIGTRTAAGRRSGFPRLLALGLLAGSLGLTASQPAFADSVSLAPLKDNTLFENATGAVSSGAGDSVFSGRNGAFGGGIRQRAVLAFALGSIPAGSTITSVNLKLVLEQTVSGNQTHTLHRVLADWGEGTSVATGGSGAPSTPNDATWIHTFFPDLFWSAAGGDFDPTPSATTTVGGLTGPYNWTSPQMAADVQAWLNNPSGNHGWLLKGNEAALNTAKRFGSREQAFEFDRPVLTVNFTPPPPCPADINGDHQVNTSDLLAVIYGWGPCLKGCPPYCVADITHDCVVNVNDLLAVINAWGPCP